MDRVHVPWWWKFGKPADFFVVEYDRIKEMIKELELIPATQAQLGIDMQLAMKEAAAFSDNPQAMSYERHWKWGGMKIPHLHFDGDIYLLNEAQWHKFSHKVIDGFKDKLTHAKAINFEQMLELSEAINNLA
ncbi:MAG: hypothetical protein ACM3PP_11610 [Candidatus Saccharibacteria bacterium]